MFENISWGISNYQIIFFQLVGGTLDIDNFYLIRNATTIQEIFCDAIFCNDGIHSFAKGILLFFFVHYFPNLVIILFMIV